MFTFTIEQKVTRTWSSFQITDERLLPLVKEHMMGMAPEYGESTEEFMGRVEFVGRQHRTQWEAFILAILGLSIDTQDEPSWVADSGGDETIVGFEMTDWYDEF